VVDGFNEGEQGQSIMVDIMWGINNINKTNVDRFNASQIGTAEWDDTFDLSHPNAQQDVFSLCNTLRGLNDLLY